MVPHLETVLGHLDYRAPSFDLESQKRNLSYYDIELESFSRWWLVDENRFKLSNLSFRIDNQANLFFSTLEKEGFDTAFSQLRMDLYGYYLEYIRQEAILPFTLRFNKGKLIGDFYGDKPITEITDKKERDGVVTQAMIDLEERIRNLGDNELIFRISPSGWTGLGYNYTESQSHIYWREGDKIRGLTIRLNAGLGKIIDFLETLEIISPNFSNYLRKLNEREAIKEVTSLNLVLNDTLNDFLESLAHHFKTDHRGKDLVDSIWQTTEFDFHQYDELTNLINWLEWRLREKDLQSKEELEMILGFVLIKMVGMEMTKQESDKNDFFYFFDNYYYLSRHPFYPDSRHLPFSVYDKIFKRLQSLPGCAGGGEKNKNTEGIFGEISNIERIFNMNPFGVQEIDDKNSSDGLKCVTCPFCKKIVDAEIVHREDGDYIHCPSCNAEVKKN